MADAKRDCDNCSSPTEPLTHAIGRALLTLDSDTDRKCEVMDPGTGKRFALLLRTRQLIEAPQMKTENKEVDSTAVASKEEVSPTTPVHPKDQIASTAVAPKATTLREKTKSTAESPYSVYSVFILLPRPATRVCPIRAIGGICPYLPEACRYNHFSALTKLCNKSTTEHASPKSRQACIFSHNQDDVMWAFTREYNAHKLARERGITRVARLWRDVSRFPCAMCESMRASQSHGSDRVLEQGVQRHSWVTLAAVAGRYCIQVRCDKCAFMSLIGESRWLIPVRASNRRKGGKRRNRRGTRGMSKNMGKNMGGMGGAGGLSGIPPSLPVNIRCLVRTDDQKEDQRQDHPEVSQMEGPSKGEMKAGPIQETQAEIAEHLSAESSFEQILHHLIEKIRVAVSGWKPVETLNVTSWISLRAEAQGSKRIWILEPAPMDPLVMIYYDNARNEWDLKYYDQ